MDCFRQLLIHELKQWKSYGSVNLEDTGKHLTMFRKATLMIENETALKLPFDHKIVTKNNSTLHDESKFGGWDNIGLKIRKQIQLTQ